MRQFPLEVLTTVERGWMARVCLPLASVLVQGLVWGDGHDAQTSLYPALPSWAFRI